MCCNGVIIAAADDDDNGDDDDDDDGDGDDDDDNDNDECDGENDDDYDDDDDGENDDDDDDDDYYDDHDTCECGQTSRLDGICFERPNATKSLRPLMMKRLTVHSSQPVKDQTAFANGAKLPGLCGGEGRPIDLRVRARFALMDFTGKSLEEVLQLWTFTSFKYVQPHL
jgi:hypothetical protein